MLKTGRVSSPLPPAPNTVTPHRLPSRPINQPADEALRLLFLLPLPAAHVIKAGYRIGHIGFDSIGQSIAFYRLPKVNSLRARFDPRIEGRIFSLGSRL